MKNSLANQTYKLLTENNISVDKQELDFQIESHPSYPSLHAITGVLDHFNIDNLAMEIPVNDEVLSQLPNSFLALIGLGDQKEFVTIWKKSGNYFLQNNIGKKENLTKNQFASKFSGVLVAVEKGEHFAEYKPKKKLAGILLSIFPAILLQILFLVFSPAFSAIGYATLAFMGALVSYILIQEENGIHTAAGNAFCSGASEKKDCKSVIHSKGSKILGVLKMSTLSLFYFLAIGISAFITILFQPNLNLHYWISIAATPIIFYSLGYQAFVVKKWCTLCLAIVLLLSFQTSIALFKLSSIELLFNAKELFAITAGSTITLMAVQFTLPLDILISELKKSKVKSFRFRRNFNLFNTLLKQSNSFNTSIHDASEIVLGDENATLNITLLTNPFCKFCVASHSLAENILRKFPSGVSITFRLNVNTSNEDDSGTKVGLRLLELFHTESKEKCLMAMHDIFSERDSKKWLNNWGNCKDQKKHLATLQKGSEWCAANQLNFTPVILINGKQFPNEYDIEELLFFMEELISESNKN